ncbi:MAG: CDP-diacylglycerol--serine O-phosphatidyltransferase [Nitratireductor sp.]|nr:CDP-diacylglycerol--serine O-phosphatidyltransferase [Nitratireductor sp.]MCB1454938.1 CDP-diacylglycerol--serine O-phosphatidyltransferase [Nitratireductor sp.]MCB1459149.1 CDP-diacylglycerol--serine O-phosphatidyltransferase [Nitratireductor sp.]
MEAPFPPFNPDGEPEAESGHEGAASTRLRDIPLRTIFPNLLTLLAICSGLTSIRFAVEDQVSLAVAAIILAAFLDGIDGRVARFLKSTSRFGAQMDSLADFVNFGVAPAMLLYFTLLDGVRSFGWIAALIYASCACLRLARFNVMLDMPDRPKWQNNFFVGVPAPAAAMTVLAPVYLLQLGLENTLSLDTFAAIYAVMIGLLMVSSLPTFSGKDMGKRVPREYVLPLLIVVVAFVGILLSWPWETLGGLALVYLAGLPFGYRAWKSHVAAEVEQRAENQNNATG